MLRWGRTATLGVQPLLVAGIHADELAAISTLSGVRATLFASRPHLDNVSFQRISTSDSLASAARSSFSPVLNLISVRRRIGIASGCVCVAS